MLIDTQTVIWFIFGELWKIKILSKWTIKMKLFVFIFYPSIVQWEFGLVFYNFIKSHKEQKSNLINWRILIENVFVRHIAFVKNV